LARTGTGNMVSLRKMERRAGISGYIMALPFAHRWQICRLCVSLVDYSHSEFAGHRRPLSDLGGACWPGGFGACRHVGRLLSAKWGNLDRDTTRAIHLRSDWQLAVTERHDFFLTSKRGAGASLGCVDVQLFSPRFTLLCGSFLPTHLFLEADVKAANDDRRRDDVHCIPEHGQGFRKIGTEDLNFSRPPSRPTWHCRMRIIMPSYLRADRILIRKPCEPPPPP